MGLPSGYYKIGNRVYTKATEGTVDYVIKYTYDTTASNYLGSSCGKWTVTDFLAHSTVFDGNTESQYSAIKTALGI
jgi:hypothetical protein